MAGLSKSPEILFQQLNVREQTGFHLKNKVFKCASTVLFSLCGFVVK